MIKPKTLGITFAILGLIFSIVGVIFHGLLGFPSIIDPVYPDFWNSVANFVLAIIGAAVAGFVFGYIFAIIYNWTAKKSK